MQERRLGSRYVLTGQLGHGAMGQVYRARVGSGDTPDVAVKVLRDELGADPALVQRFLQEGRLLKSVDHPNVVRVRDLVAEGDQLALVMDLVEGGDLRRAVPTPLAEPQAARIVAGIADGLAAVHAAGITHRDLKPENVLLERGPEGARPRIADFGVSRFASATTTSSHGMTGTVGYIAPEVAKGAAATPASDVYSLGVILYELCVGHGPFQAEHPMALIRAHAEDPVPRPPAMSEGLWELIESLLAKEPSERPTADEVAHRLSLLAPQLGDAGPGTAPPGWFLLGPPGDPAAGGPEAPAAPPTLDVPVDAPKDVVRAAAILRPEGPRPPIVPVGPPPGAGSRRPRLPVGVAAAALAATGLVGAAIWVVWPSSDVATRSAVVLGADLDPVAPAALPVPEAAPTTTGTTAGTTAPTTRVPPAPLPPSGRPVGIKAVVTGTGTRTTTTTGRADQPLGAPAARPAVAAAVPPPAPAVVPPPPSSSTAPTTSTSPADPRHGTVGLHRYWNATTKDHFYTTNYAELGAGAAGYVYEGVQAYVYPGPTAGAVALHRYWNATTTDHFYTTNYAELGAGEAGYVYEGVQAYVR